MHDATAVSTRLDRLENTDAGEMDADSGFYAHVGSDDVSEALEILDTRENSIEILRLEPSCSAEMYVKFE